MLPFYSTFSGPRRTRQVALGRPFLDGDGHPARPCREARHRMQASAPRTHPAPPAAALGGNGRFGVKNNRPTIHRRRRSPFVLGRRPHPPPPPPRPPPRGAGGGRRARCASPCPAAAAAGAPPAPGRPDPRAPPCYLGDRHDV